jgi:hypothetical protein
MQCARCCRRRAGLGCSHGPMPIRIFSRSDRAAGLVTPRQTLFVAAIGGSSTRRWEAGQQAQPQAQGRWLAALLDGSAVYLALRFRLRRNCAVAVILALAGCHTVSCMQKKQRWKARYPRSVLQRSHNCATGAARVSTAPWSVLSWMCAKFWGKCLMAVVSSL